jgi:ATP synthase protein I
LESASHKVLPGRKTTKDILAYSSVGLQLAGTLLICVYAGYWIDSRYMTSPWFLLAGAAVGMIAGFYNLFKELGALEKNKEGSEKVDDKRRKWL